MIPPPVNPPAKSSLFRREVSKEDAIIQFLRPQIAGKVDNSLDVFERLVNYSETLTINGIMIQPGGARYNLTPADIAANLDEFGEVQNIAKLGREFLNAIGYVSQRTVTPPVGSAPVGSEVRIIPIKSQLPGEEPLQSVGVVSKGDEFTERMRKSVQAIVDERATPEPKKKGKAKP